MSMSFLPLPSANPAPARPRDLPARGVGAAPGHGGEDFAATLTGALAARSGTARSDREESSPTRGSGSGAAGADRSVAPGAGSARSRVEGGGARSPGGTTAEASPPRVDHGEGPGEADTGEPPEAGAPSPGPGEQEPRPESIPLSLPGPTTVRGPEAEPVGIDAPAGPRAAVEAGGRESRGVPDITFGGVSLRERLVEVIGEFPPAQELIGRVDAPRVELAGSDGHVVAGGSPGPSAQTAGEGQASRTDSLGRARRTEGASTPAAAVIAAPDASGPMAEDVRPLDAAPTPDVRERSTSSSAGATIRIQPFAGASGEASETGRGEVPVARGSSAGIAGPRERAASTHRAEPELPGLREAGGTVAPSSGAPAAAAVQGDGSPATEAPAPTTTPADPAPAPIVTPADPARPGTVTSAGEAARWNESAPSAPMPAVETAGQSGARTVTEAEGATPTGTSVPASPGTREASAATASRADTQPAAVALFDVLPELEVTVTAAPDAGRTDRDPDRLDPELRVRIDRVIERMRSEFGHEVTLVEGYRSPARQRQLYEQGRTRPGPVVTWTTDSRHSQGRAADLVIDHSWGNPEAYARLQRVARQEGLRTLGTMDPGHVELPAAGDGDYQELRFRPVASERMGWLEPSRSGGVATVARVASVARVARPALPGSAGRSGDTATVSPPAADDARPTAAAPQAASIRGLWGDDEGPSTGDRSWTGLTAARNETAGAEVLFDPASHIGAPTSQPVVGVVRGGGVVAGADAAARVDEILRLQDQAAARPAGVRLDLSDADGEGTRIRLDLRGGSLDTAIEVGDEALASRLRTRSGELQRALESRGLDADLVRVRSTRGVGDPVDPLLGLRSAGRVESTRTADSGASQHDRQGRGEQEHDPLNDTSRDAHGRRGWNGQRREEAQ